MNKMDLILGDCLNKIKEIPENSVDAIVTDPPYELGFMNKEWDNTGIAYDIKMWQECLRVLKPGGHLLSFGGTRTYHRMACAIEDAGFEIRDQIQWIHGQGFPKSQNISKMMDKTAGAEREVIGIKPGHEEFANRKTSGDSKFKDDQHRPWMEDEESRNKYHQLTAPATDEAKQWDGWGTALKPANEPICLARKPISEKTIAKNVLKWGTGGINIDGCRIDYVSEYDKKHQNATNGKFFGGKGKSVASSLQPQGRFPANIIHDGSDEVLENFPESKGQQGDLKGHNKDKSKKDIFGEMGPAKNHSARSDYGSSARFFYCAKPSSRERGKDNNHPTVKPISLMGYLCKLITPPEGTVLDPFMGSGTTGIACKNLGLNFIGIEKEGKYFKTAQKRILLGKRDDS